MFLKSIEMQGFKSFANRMVLEFHNGITGIVGPNGSGKSNVADAVRWVLGEQSAKQLRGESMQDVIFSGTETRRPLSYAYVAITLDNTDHALPVDYNEVTVARRVYRSGENEYLLNGAPCRLKDVRELFYDTGIGKEGYSIIGQGQIEKIISGKPEERRELFDEAVGIVKYKKRKEASEKKLSDERDNLVRVNDILKELEGRVGPLEKQSETAKRYLSLKERQKKLDVNMYLLEVERIDRENTEVTKNADSTQREYDENKAALEQIRTEYASLEQEIHEKEEKIESLRNDEASSKDTKNKLVNQTEILTEQIRSAENSGKDLAERRQALENDRTAKQEELSALEKDLAGAKEQEQETAQSLDKAKKDYEDLEQSIHELTDKINAGHERIVGILNERAENNAAQEKARGSKEQAGQKKAELVKELLAEKSREAQLEKSCADAKAAFDALSEKTDALQKNGETLKEKAKGLREKQKKAEADFRAAENSCHAISSRLDTLKGIAERYEGYGNSIRAVMQRKEDTPGIIGVVSDLITVEEKYETAVETALGGNIQNIVTEDEATAKEMIAYLKHDRLGRATFLPLTSVREGKERIPEQVLRGPGVIGKASDLADCDERYRGVIRYLIGRVVVCDTLDHAIAFQKRNNYSYHVVTLEGEYLRPGGSMTGGAFRHSQNLLGRNRNIEKLTEELAESEKAKDEAEKASVSYETAIGLAEDDIEESRKAYEDASIELNTAKIALEQAEKDLSDMKDSLSALAERQKKADEDFSAAEEAAKHAAAEIERAGEEEKRLNEETEKAREELDQKTYLETSASRTVSEIQVDAANAAQKVSFIQENIDRVRAEIRKIENDAASLEDASGKRQTDIEEKKENIQKLQETISAADAHLLEVRKDIDAAVLEKNSMDEKYRSFFDRRSEVSDRIQNLDKELFRLNQRRQKLNEELEYQNNYMWDEYELTLHAAMELKDENAPGRAEMKKETASIRDEIRRMGPVNVNAIDEYKEVSERYEFLKKQHDDLVSAEENLVKIIADLDSGMRSQFDKGFREIRVEFDKVFRALFGGGKASLELEEGEDVLETGIRIAAQPPGKKLQNIMQMSGGEKALTAIALLFAIQNMKPSPFCLLDEIEAALDDANVDRFAKYLHKLTKNTQFIVITHRRGTMNAADRLYGITMQEKGVSALVSVNLIEDQLN